MGKLRTAFITTLILGANTLLAETDSLTPQVAQALQNLDNNLSYLQSQTFTINSENDRKYVIWRLEQLTSTLQAVSQELSLQAPPAAWYPVNGHDCLNYCQSIGRISGMSKEGAQCVSGENRAASALAVIPFTYGCFPSHCSPEHTSKAVSMGGYCYKPGQKHDNDRTDITVGCFCRS